MIDIFFKILPVTVFIIATGITPGPNNIMLATSGANIGFKKSLPLLFGIALGFLFFLLLTTFGFNLIFTRYPKLYLIFKVIGTVYLLYLAYSIIKSAIDNRTVNILNFKNAIIFQFLNPKVWGMSITAITSFSLSGENYLISAVMISFLFIILYLPCGLIWILFGAFLKDKLLNNKKHYKIFNFGMGSMLILTALFISIS